MGSDKPSLGEIHVLKLRPGNGALFLTTLEVWTDRIVIHHVLQDLAEESFSLQLSDDQGTTYQRGGDFSGGDYRNFIVGVSTFHPAPPSNARELFLSVARQGSKEVETLQITLFKQP